MDCQPTPVTAIRQNSSFQLTSFQGQNIVKPLCVVNLMLKNGVKAEMVGLNSIGGPLAQKLSILEGSVFPKNFVCSPKEIMKLNAKDSLTVLVARNPGAKKIIGCLIGFRDTKESVIFRVSALAVRKEYSRKGLGSAMLKQYQEIVKRSGGGRILLKCQPYDVYGEHLYFYYLEKGFNIVNFKKTYGYLMEKTVQKG
jgi:GNAT superfamily N-acetyltransferase